MSGSGDSVGITPTVRRINQRPSSLVTALAAVPQSNGRTLLASGDEAGVVRLWDPVSGTSTGQPFEKHDGSTVCALVAYSSPVEGRSRFLLVSGDDRGNVLLWNPLTGVEENAMPGHSDRVNALARVPQLADRDQDLVVSGGADGEILIWDPAAGSGRLLPRRPGGGSILTLAVAEDAEGTVMLVSADADGAVVVWDPYQSVEGRLLTRVDGPVRALAVLPGQRPLLAVGDDLGELTVWDLLNRRALAGPVSPHAGLPIQAVVAWRGPGPGEARVASLGDDGFLVVSNAGLSQPLATLSVGSDDGGALGLILPDVLAAPIQLAAGGGPGAVRVWAPERELEARTLDLIRAPVDCLAVVGDGSTAIVAAGCEDDQIRLWDLGSGRALGSWAAGQAGVRSLTGLDVEGEVGLASGGRNGLIKIWALDGGPDRSPRRLTGHDKPVFALFPVHDGDGRQRLVSVAEDREVRVWDPAGDTVVDKFRVTGRDPLRLATLVRSADGRTPYLALLTDRGRYELWRIFDRGRVRDAEIPRKGNRFTTLTFRAGESGRPEIVAGDDAGHRYRWPAFDPEDLTVWDPEPPVAGEGAGPALDEVAAWSAVTVLPGAHGDQSLLAWADSVGHLQVREARDPSARPPVWLDQVLDDPVRVLVRWDYQSSYARFIAADTDGVLTILVWPTEPSVDVDPQEREGGTRGEPRRRGSTHRVLIAARDDAYGPDTLGRTMFAGHLQGMLGQLTLPDLDLGPNPDSDHGPSTGWAVMHVDGRWGSGKTMLIDLLRRRLTSGRPVARQPAAVTDPIVVRYDAWRECAVAPEWWSLGSAVHQAVHRQRAWPTRLVMMTGGLAARLNRSKPAAAAVIVFLATLAGLVFWHRETEAAAPVLTLLTGVAAFGLAGGRVLFWTAPAFGKLYARSDDNPLEEISAIVERLRHWTPRSGCAQRVVDWLVTGYLLVLALVAGLGVAWSGWVRPGPRWPGWLRPGVPWSAWVPHELRNDPRAWTVLAELVLLPVAYFGYVLWATGSRRKKRGRGHRRPILLVIDDIDRCAGPRVVKLLETVHALLRYDPYRTRPKPGSVRRWFRIRLERWRAPAPVFVLVLADGRWIRQSFQAVYEDFEALGSPVHSLGADFLQKLFDHTVLVPALTEDQIRLLLREITALPERPAPKALPHRWPLLAARVFRQPSAGPAVRPGAPAAAAPSGPQPLPPTSGAVPDPETADRDALEEVSRIMAEKGPGSQHSEDVESRIIRLSRPAQSQARGDQAQLDATQAAVAAHSVHLLNRYPELMPANPRLVKRIANAWNMLMVIKAHLGHDQPDEVVVRAAVMFTRFPTLVDDLLTVTEPPKTVPVPHLDGESGLDAGAGDAQAAKRLDAELAWLRPDVQALLRRPDGTAVPIEAIARCYGRQFDRPLADIGS